MPPNRETSDVPRPHNRLHSWPSQRTTSSGSLPPKSPWPLGPQTRGVLDEASNFNSSCDQAAGQGSRPRAAAASSPRPASARAIHG
eukprot:CAMPEP_0119385542 /NCGR_PEP_ID=MMETSP1334-20130426/91684_1 /TAXON_ID=127549 /ORGANISM="Calcidiscus leptoporus, Strain RCC1130" /LENGTH=85 /DNA_ID=CAMNT_0007406843 /DNA_START=370 /DNA_END=627 /DNA_ORIENTATION=-